MRKLVCLCACLACISATFANDSAQALQDAFVAALKANDAQGLANCYASDAVNYPLDTMVGMGPESVRKSWEAFFGAYRIVDASLSDSQLEVRGDLAAAWGLFTIMAEPIGGGDVVEMKGRYMDVARPIDGSWLYVADHASMPLPAAEN